MSMLSGRLGASSGIGGPVSGGAYTSPAYGGTSTMYPASSTGSGLYGTAQTGVGDLTSGRLSLAALLVLVVGVTVFYIASHKIQGGG